jgi:hypothetical protein
MRYRDRAPKCAENGHLLQVPARGRREASPQPSLLSPIGGNKPETFVAPSP